ncbi:hypothetical protein [Nocardia goodfellowii]|uniref:Uncharacterized protein n=1 Tax=Nocardia goodfellowii TaxID=882446 RepID=A0ABS4QRD2_9NOCA|nr:hypothetical protein [Nocardia goodfellowii]MBP2193673.1 hypothetical protein [Nocardia goodfellowii]
MSSEIEVDLEAMRLAGRDTERVRDGFQRAADAGQACLDQFNATYSGDSFDSDFANGGDGDPGFREYMSLLIEAAASCATSGADVTEAQDMTVTMLSATDESSASNFGRR